MSTANSLSEPTLMTCTEQVKPKPSQVKAKLPERITYPAVEGTYIFEVVEVPEGCRASMHYFQHQPEDEAAEQTIIRETICQDWTEALTLVCSWYEAEADRDFKGYRLTKDQAQVVRWSHLREAGVL